MQSCDSRMNSWLRFGLFELKIDFYWQFSFSFPPKYILSLPCSNQLAVEKKSRLCSIFRWISDVSLVFEHYSDVHKKLVKMKIKAKIFSKANTKFVCLLSNKTQGARDYLESVYQKSIQQTSTRLCNLVKAIMPLAKPSSHTSLLPQILLPPCLPHPTRACSLSSFMYLGPK